MDECLISTVMKGKDMIDKECICCRRYYSKSCPGIEDRKRDAITYENCCSGHLSIDNESECNCDVELFNQIQIIKNEIGVK